jgi:hypothetical protein
MSDNLSKLSAQEVLGKTSRNWTDEQAMRIGYLIIQKSPATAEDLLREVELEKVKVMEHNKNCNAQWKDTTDNYQAKCIANHRNIYKDMTIDKRSRFKKLIQGWI